MKRNLASIAGFLMFLLGFLSLVLSLVGLKLDVLSFLYSISPGFAFFVHLLFLVGGLAILYVARVGINNEPDIES